MGYRGQRIRLILTTHVTVLRYSIGLLICYSGIVFLFEGKRWAYCGKKYIARIFRNLKGNTIFPRSPFKPLPANVENMVSSE